MAALLDVRDLVTRFHTPEGTVYAVNGISFHVKEGETLAVVGESGCGKSVSMLSILGLIPIPPGEIASGSALYAGQDLLRIPEKELEHVRGKQVSMIFQDPMTSLNPVLTVRRQLCETLCVHEGMGWEEAHTSEPLPCWNGSAFRTQPAGWTITRTSFQAVCASG
jgi:oligopeptide transport system ATP-binding protein